MVCIGNGHLHYHKRNLHQVKWVILFSLTLTFAKPIQAQTHNEFWGRLSFSKNINHRWNATLDLNLRQQSNYWIGNKNNFELPMMRNARLWLVYNPGNKYSLINTIAIAQTADVKEGKKELLTTTELLYGAGISRKDSLKNIQIKNRLLSELRYVQSQTGSNIVMLRYRLQNNFTIKVKKISQHSVLAAVLNSELFFKTREKQTGFDQYRIAGIMQWHVHNTEYAFGLQETLQELHNRLQKRNQLLLYLTVYL